jgi:hypothetical protein
VVRRFTGTALRVAWPRSVRAASGLRLRGTLTGADGVPLGGRTVRLFVRPAGTSAYLPLDRVRTSRGGGFVLRARPTRAASYYVEYAGSERAIGARSDRHVVTVRRGT